MWNSTRKKNWLRIESQQEIIFIFHIFLVDFIFANHVKEKISQQEKITKQEKNNWTRKHMHLDSTLVSCFKI